VGRRLSDEKESAFFFTGFAERRRKRPTKTPRPEEEVFFLVRARLRRTAFARVLIHTTQYGLAFSVPPFLVRGYVRSAPNDAPRDQADRLERAVRDELACDAVE